MLENCKFPPILVVLEKIQKKLIMHYLSKNQCQDQIPVSVQVHRILVRSVPRSHQMLLALILTTLK